jgi:hypothetical protein
LITEKGLVPVGSFIKRRECVMPRIQVDPNDLQGAQTALNNALDGPMADFVNLVNNTINHIESVYSGPAASMWLESMRTDILASVQAAARQMGDYSLQTGKAGQAYSELESSIQRSFQ